MERRIIQKLTGGAHQKVIPMVKLGRATARALVDAGYMPLPRYVDIFSDMALHLRDHSEASLTPEINKDYEPAFGGEHGTNTARSRFKLISKQC